MLDHSLCTIADLEPGDHLCCLYETEEERRMLLMPFLCQGLERGEKVLYVVDACLPETILGYLREPSTGSGQALDVEPYLARGQLAILTCDDTYMRHGVFDPEGMITLLQAETERALAEGYRALRGSSEMTWALRGLPGSERLIEYEARLNDFLPGSQCLVICQYDRRHFGPEVLVDVLRIHPIRVVGTVRYDNFIAEDTLKNTSKCAKGFSCLCGERECLCEVEYAVGDKVLFVECTDRSCRYRTDFGYSSICTCPARKEIFNRYRI